jgi:23S rRNA (guanine745-N1)-methyltransferase
LQKAVNTAGSTIFMCPVCGKSLSCSGKSYTCINSHCYDISGSGYVNLLLANRKRSRNPGDSTEMLEARKNFLNRGYYSSLAERILFLIRRCMNEKKFMPCNILDAGCGEGYYIDCLCSDDMISKSASCYGIDISKDGIRSASRRNSSVHFAVANIYSLPVNDASVNIILNVFAPFNEAEFLRVLDDNGIVISVTPGARHLSGLKNILYEEIIPNDEEINTSEKLIESHTERITYEISINSNEDISNLIKMTPYYFKTGKEKINHVLENITELETVIDFIIRIFEKNKWRHE